MDLLPLTRTAMWNLSLEFPQDLAFSSMRSLVFTRPRDSGAVGDHGSEITQQAKNSAALVILELRINAILHDHVPKAFLWYGSERQPQIKQKILISSPLWIRG